MKIYSYEGKKNICGERVRARRLRLRMSQSDLAAQLQVAGVLLERDSVSRIEIGARFVADYELMTLARILGCLLYTSTYSRPATTIPPQAYWSFSPASIAAYRPASSLAMAWKPPR